MLELGPAKVTRNGGAYGQGSIIGFPLSGDINWPFGPRGVIQTPQGPTMDFHYGIDIPKPEGTPIIAPASGYVNIANNMDDGTGFILQVFTPERDFFYEMYHLKEPARDYATGRDLEPGDFVSRGMTVGVVGTTGKSTGPHLHFAVMDLRGSGVYVNPLDYFTETPTVTPPPPAAVVYPVPDVTWIQEGWAAVGSKPWEHRYPLRAQTVLPGALINLVRDGRDATGGELFHLEIEDYEPGT